MKKLKLGLVQTADPLKLCVHPYKAFCKKIQELPDVELLCGAMEINSAEDAQQVAANFEAQQVDVTVLMCCSLVGDGRIIHPFMRSSQEVLVWCLPEPTREGPLLLNSMTCANLYTSSAAQMAGIGGKRAKWLYGQPEDPLMLPRLMVSIRSVQAQKQLSGATLVQVGKTADGFINLGYDAEAIRRNSGVEVVFYSLEDIFRDMKAIPDEMADSLAETIAEGAVCCTASHQQLNTSARLILAVRQLKERYHAAAFAISCWPEFQDDMHISTCLAFGRLGEEGIPVSCEGDVPGALTMLLAKALSDCNPMLMDLVSMDVTADAVSFWHCGMGLPCYADSQGFPLRSTLQIPVFLNCREHLWI